MKHYTIILAALITTTCATAQAAGVSDSDMGLSKTSVYHDPTPQAANYLGEDPGKNMAYAKSYHTAPPMIPHKVDTFVPVTFKNNMCLTCHHNPALIGKSVQGMPTPVSKSHYVDPSSGKQQLEKVDGSRFVCTQCHAPQADATPLVENTFTPDK